jgi:putative acetyltransferase
MEIIHADSPVHMTQIKILFREYFDWLAKDFGVDMSYQHIASELDALPGKYARPLGSMLLAIEEGEPYGCLALRPLEGEICEVKRLYVRPQFRGRGTGKALFSVLIQDARQAGYKTMRLDTAIFLPEAMKLYQTLGFKEIGPYYEVPEVILKITVFMELTLS